jgi:membrane-bound ClpP family serine protease
MVMVPASGKLLGAAAASAGRAAVARLGVQQHNSSGLQRLWVAELTAAVAAAVSGLLLLLVGQLQLAAELAAAGQLVHRVQCHMLLVQPAALSHHRQQQQQ